MTAIAWLTRWKLAAWSNSTPKSGRIPSKLATSARNKLEPKNARTWDYALRMKTTLISTTLLKISLMKINNSIQRMMRNMKSWGRVASTFATAMAMPPKPTLAMRSLAWRRNKIPVLTVSKMIMYCVFFVHHIISLTCTLYLPLISHFPYSLNR